MAFRLENPLHASMIPSPGAAGALQNRVPGLPGLPLHRSVKHRGARPRPPGGARHADVTSSVNLEPSQKHEAKATNVDKRSLQTVRMVTEGLIRMKTSSFLSGGEKTLLTTS